jgi:outer membrane protein assembly factor BamB
VAAVVALLLVAIVTAVVVVLLRAPHNVSNPSVSFTQPKTTTTVVRRKPPPDTFAWPLYGYNDARTREFVADPAVHPPFRVSWRFGGNALIEFPPVIFHGAMYFMDDGATVKGVNLDDGHQLWSRHLGTLSAASPAIDARLRLVFVPVLADTGTSPGDGRFAALSLSTGRVVWSHSLPAGSESSPLVAGGMVYFGDQAGEVYALHAATGKVAWTYQASGAVKGGPALSGGLLYFGDYAGRAYALDPHTGHQIWAVGTNGSQYGFGSGNFYSTPAVAFGRVYMGNTDGFVYSFAARTGQLAWSTSTGAYVYASASVADLPGVGPTVYVGSYSGEFYAFDARSGAVRWSHYAGGRISGSSTVVNGIVYYSDLGTKTSTGLNARTGATVFRFPDGAFTPVIAEPSAIILSGYDVIYKLLPKGRR